MRICLMTPGQPATDPRLVKEADALVEAGHQVQVFCADLGVWPRAVTDPIENEAPWACAYVGGRAGSLRFLYTRVRHKLARTLLPGLRTLPAVRYRALCRCFSEMFRAAIGYPADIYIAHHPAVLPAAVAAARRHGALAGYDAEDFLTSEIRAGQAKDPLDSALEQLEAECLPQCVYGTAASPGIARAYAAKYGIPEPVTILNVFPLDHRPPHFRTGEPGAPLRLYWFSQTIGRDQGLEDVVRALGSLPDCAIELHLRGRWDKGYEGDLRHLAGECGVNNDRLIAHPLAAPREMIRLASAYDIGLVVEPGRIVNTQLCLTNKWFTYLLAGNAIVATDTPAQSLLAHDNPGAVFLYSPGDVRSLAEQLRFWHTSREKLEEARRLSWSLGETTYNWDREKVKLLRLLEDVRTAKGPAPLAACGVRA